MFTFPYSLPGVCVRMCVIQVLTLLEVMNLGQYKDKFKIEQVDGEILAECDESILKDDLLVVSAMHRNRLMKLVTGKHSAYSLMEVDNNVYSTLEHRT